MSDDIRDWLVGLGLSEYVAAFAENRIEQAHLIDLNEDDLRELGVAAMGDRKTLLRAIADLRANDSAPVRADNASRSETITSEAERRQVTVMFCDLAGSTELSMRLDPEDYREIIRAYQDACAGVIDRYDGYVAKFMGDGVLAYFGWPRGHEDDAGRAISAGLGVVEAVAALSPANGETEPLKVRIGIATGPVVVGDIVGEGAAQEAAVTGSTPNLAARLQEIAPPNSVVIAETTHALAGGLFDYEELGGRTLKGFDGTTVVWRVLGERRVESRFSAAHPAALTPLIGRDEELSLLSRRWEQAKSGEGQVVLLSGEPGIGKSRLTQALQDWIGDEAHTRLLFQCSPHRISSALSPTINQLEFAAGFDPDDDPDVRLDKLEALFSRSGQPTKELMALTAALLSIPENDRYPLPELTAQRQKDRTLAVLIDQLVGLASRTPVLFVYEDAHWIDPTSLELLELVIERIVDLPVLVVVTYRPEFTAPWIGMPHVTLQALNRLTPRDSTLMTERLIGDKNLSPELLGQLAERTDGVPLFIEELTRSVVEADVASDGGDVTANVVIPATLQDALEARFDRSPAVREVAQVGAAIGRDFDYDLLREAASLTPSVLDAALEELIESGLIFARGAPPDASYTFKHALIQDTAFDSMVRGKRQELHVQIARILEQRAKEGAATQPEFIAHHLVAGGQPARSVDYWMAAAKQALSRAAYTEANSFVDEGLTAIQSQARAIETMATDVDLRFLKYAAQYPLGDPQSLLTILAEAERIVIDMNDPVRLCKVLSTQTYVLASAGQVDAAIAVGKQNIESVTKDGDVNAVCHSKLMLGRALYAAGRYGEAIRHATDAMELIGADVERGKGYAELLSHPISARAWLILCHAERGEFEQGERLCDDALRLLEHIRGGMHDRLWLANAIGRLNVLKRDFAGAITAVESLLQFCENNYPVYFPRVASSLGAGYAASGDSEKGLQMLRQAERKAGSIGFQFGRALVLAQLAEVLLGADNVEEARDTATRAIEAARNAGERGNEGWGTFVLGKVYMNLENRADAIASYHRALSIAEKLEMIPLKARCLQGLGGLMS